MCMCFVGVRVCVFEEYVRWREGMYVLVWAGFGCCLKGVRRHVCVSERACAAVFHLRCFEAG